jgi:hypothetical protein
MTTAFMKMLSTTTFDFRRLQRPLLLIALAALFVAPAQAQLQKTDFKIRALATGSVPIGPDQLSDQYGTGRGLNTGVGVYLSQSFDLQTSFEYTKYDLSSPEGLDQNLLRSNLPKPQEVNSGGDLRRISVGLGLKYSISSGKSFRAYLRGMGHISSLTRQQYRLAPSSPDFVRVGPRPINVKSETQLATGFSAGLGLLFPIGYTSAFLIEPSFTSHYAESETLQGFDVRVGIILGEF